MLDANSLDGLSLIMPEAIGAYGKSVEGEAPSPATADPFGRDLDSLKTRFESGEDVAAVFKDLLQCLRGWHSSMPAAEWRSVSPHIARHGISEMLLQDPFTGWSNRKPRGYSGDAALLDFVYGHPSIGVHVEGTTDFGRKLYEVTRQAVSPQAVRERREILAREIDSTAGLRDGAEIMAIAAGHLREAELSAALATGSLRRLVALDQDPLSIDEVNSMGNPLIETVKGSVRDVIGRYKKFGTFDLVYSAGLYDYLEHQVAVKMTRRCLSMLKPGGSYLFANFGNTIPETGYMHTFMRWELILRSREEMLRIAEESAGDLPSTTEIFSGVHDAIHYARITRLS